MREAQSPDESTSRGEGTVLQSMRVRKSLLVGIVVTTCLAVVYWAVFLRESGVKVGDSESDLAEIKPFRRPSPPPNGFVGSSVCAGCHPGVSESYHQHPMGHSARPASIKHDLLTTAKTSKDGPAMASFLASPGLEYRIRHQGEQVLHEEILRDDEGKIVTRQTVPISFAIGSGKRGRSYIIDRNGLLFVSPIAWYTQKKRWDLSPGYKPFQHARFERFAPGLCLRCHVGRLNPVSREFPDRFQTPAFREASIGCENCHGPGRDHVAYRNQDRPEGRDPIINLSQLSPPLRDSICIQCHLSGRDVALRYGRTPYDFRPGMPITDVFCLLTMDHRKRTFQQRAKAVSHVEQMVSSKCYQKSAGKLGCISCHNPHATPSESDRVSHYRNRCLNCHQDSGQTCSVPERKRKQAPHHNSCISCHMRAFEATDIPHTTQTDHRILRKPVANVDKLFAPEKPPAFEDLVIFGADKGNLSPASRLRAKTILLARLLDSQPSRTHAQSAYDTLLRIVKAAPDDIETLDALALCSRILGKPDEAIHYWKKVLELSPRHTRTLHSLAMYLFQLRKYQEAAIYFDRFMKENPWLADVYAHRSITLVQLGRQQEAIRDIETAIRLNPTVPRYYQGLAELARRAGRQKDAKSAEDMARRLKRFYSRRRPSP